MPTSLDNILLRVNAGRLDADLAAGLPPEASPRHTSRARRLVTSRMRHALADDWGRLLLIAHGPPGGGLSNRAPIRRQEVRRAERSIQKLITALRATGPIPARGVALALRLLTDGGSPIYYNHAPSDIAATVTEALEHLDPATPLLPSSSSLCGV